MAVRAKGRRKIICANHQYVWFVDNDKDSCGQLILHIISADKKIILRYPLNATNPYIISEGKVFQNTISDGCWQRYLVPIKPVKIITPKFVSELIFWAVNGEDPVPIQWDGNDIPV